MVGVKVKILKGAVFIGRSMERGVGRWRVFVGMDMCKGEKIEYYADFLIKKQEEAENRRRQRLERER